MSPVFVVGVFTPSHYKLGEAIGSSLKMAEYRACEDALKRIYLSRSVRPASEASTSQQAFRLPSDTLAHPSEAWQLLDASRVQLGDDAVDLESSSRTGKLAAELQRAPWTEKARVDAISKARNA